MNTGFRCNYDWFSWKVPVWLEHLSPLAQQTGVTAVEIGSWEGRSAVWLLQNILSHETCSLHCIHPWSSPNGAIIEAAFDHSAAVVSRHSRAKLVKHKGFQVIVRAPENKDLVM